MFCDFRLRHTFQEWIAPKTLKTDQDNLHMKISSIKRRFERCKFRLPKFKESSVRGHHIRVPLQNARFLLLSTNLEWEWLQIDKDLLRIVTSTADKLSGGTNIDEFERPWNRILGFSQFFAILGCNEHSESELSPQITGATPRQPAHEIKLKLSRVLWALAHFFFSFAYPGELRKLS